MRYVARSAIIVHMATNELPIGSTEAASILNVSRSTVNRWAEIGKLIPVFKGEGPTGARYFKRRDIERLKQQLSKTEAA